jgi:hypothetical protein
VIGRVVGTGRSFKGPISYNLTGRDGTARTQDRVAWVECWNLPTRDPEVAACMMAATAGASISDTRKPSYLFSISCDPDDPVDPDTLRRIAARTIRDMGLQEYEVVVFCHKDRSHPHLHFVVNRVHPERGTLWSPWRDFYRIERSLRAQELELGLRVVPGWLTPTSSPDLAIDSGQDRAPAQLRPNPAPKRGDAAFVREVTERAEPVMQRARSWAELESGLGEVGLKLRVKGGGFRLTDGHRDVKASEVGREFSRRNIEERFGPYPDYRARMAVAQATPMPHASEIAPAAAVPARETQSPAVGSPPSGGAAVTGPAQSTPTERPSAPALSARGTVEPSRSVQLTLAFADPPAAVAPPPLAIEPPALEPSGSPQLTLALDEPSRPVSSSRRRTEPPPFTRPEVAPPRIETPAPSELPTAEPHLASPPAARPTAPAAAEPPQINERPSLSSGRKISPDLLRVRELIHEAGDWYRANDGANDARNAEDAPAQELKRLKELERTAIAKAERLWEVLVPIYVDPSSAALELTRFRSENMWLTTKYALKETPQKFGMLRAARLWYTMGPGRKDVENVLQPLENAVESERERPTQAELDAARANLAETVRLHGAALDARGALRNPDVCEREAASLLQPLFWKLSAEEIAELLAALLPPEDREGAKLIERIITLAISLNNMLSRQSYRGRELE